MLVETGFGQPGAISFVLNQQLFRRPKQQFTVIQQAESISVLGVSFY